MIVAEEVGRVLEHVASYSRRCYFRERRCHVTPTRTFLVNEDTTETQKCSYPWIPIWTTYLGPQHSRYYVLHYAAARTNLSRASLRYMVDFTYSV